MNAAHMAASAPPTVAEKVKGARENWDAEGFDLWATIQAVAKDKSLMDVLMFDPSALRARAKLQKRNFNVPGCRAYDKGSVAIRAAA